MVKNHIKIINILLENQDKELNISMISKYSKLDYKTTYNLIKLLEKEKIISIETFGKNKKIILNKKIHPFIFEAEYTRKQKFFKKNKNISIIYRRLYELEYPLIILLFGSYAKAKATKHSDIDLLIICEEKTKHKIQDVLDLFPLKIHPTFITFKEFTLMLKTKEFNVVSEAIKKNIILIGIEEYYRFLENVK